MEDSEGTVGTVVQPFVSDPAVVDGGTWSSYPRADFTWASLVALRHWDVRRVGVAALSSPMCRNSPLPFLGAITASPSEVGGAAGRVSGCTISLPHPGLW